MQLCSTLLSILATAHFVVASPLVARAPADGAAAGNAKSVVAHHMVGNTFPYTVQDWKDDISLASSKSFDAFALNMGSDVWQPDHVSDAYKAAADSGSNFKMFLSFDMTSLSCKSADDAGRLRKIVSDHMDNPAQFKVNGKALVTTFDGGFCTFGRANAQEGWAAEFAQHSDLAGKIAFVPTFFVDPSSLNTFNGVIDGACAWDSGWPNEVTSEVAQQALAAGKDKKFLELFSPISKISAEASSILQKLKDSLSKILSAKQKAIADRIGDNQWDSVYLAGLQKLHTLQKREDAAAQKPVYMGAAAGLFFAHFSYKNTAYLGDQFLIAKRWESIISRRDDYDIIEVLSWNDYGESHYIGPIKGDQPAESKSWTTGFDHTPFLDVNKYYIDAFKSGSFPEITQDRVVAWARPHPALAQASDSAGPPKNGDLFDDMVWALCFASAPGSFTLNGQTIDVPIGVSKIAGVIQPGDGISAKFERNGGVTAQADGGSFKFNGSPSNYNYNYFVVGSAGQGGVSQSTPPPTAYTGGQNGVNSGTNQPVPAGATTGGQTGQNGGTTGPNQLAPPAPGSGAYGQQGQNGGTNQAKPADGTVGGQTSQNGGNTGPNQPAPTTLGVGAYGQQGGTNQAKPADGIVGSQTSQNDGTTGPNQPAPVAAAGQQGQNGAANQAVPTNAPVVKPPSLAQPTTLTTIGAVPTGRRSYGGPRNRWG